MIADILEPEDTYRHIFVLPFDTHFKAVFAVHSRGIPACESFEPFEIEGWLLPEIIDVFCGFQDSDNLKKRLNVLFLKFIL